MLTDFFLEQSRNNILLCEGIDDGLFGTLSGLTIKYPSQCYELPCSENASVGMALGAACYGLLPVICYQRVEFVLLALEQLFNNSSKVNYLSNGERCNPSLFRLIIGRGWGQGPSHAQSLESVFLQIPDINLFLPVFPEDSKYIFDFFPLCKSPTISLEHRWIYNALSSGIKIDEPIPYVIREGTDITLVAGSYNVLIALKVAESARLVGLSIEVINLFCISYNAGLGSIMKSAEKTRRLIFIDLSHSWNGLSNNYVSRLCQAGANFDSPPIVIGCKESFSPSSFRLAADYYVACRDIGTAIADSANLEAADRTKFIELCGQLDAESPIDQPSQSFIGPF